MSTSLPGISPWSLTWIAHRSAPSVQIGPHFANHVKVNVPEDVEAVGGEVDEDGVEADGIAEYRARNDSRVLNDIREDHESARKQHVLSIIEAVILKQVLHVYEHGDQLGSKSHQVEDENDGGNVLNCHRLRNRLENVEEAVDADEHDAYLQRNTKAAHRSRSVLLTYRIADPLANPLLPLH